MAKQNKAASNGPDRKCACGCGKAVNAGRSFLQGHDQRLRGQLRRGEPQKPETRAFLKENTGFARGHARKAAPAKAPKTTKKTAPARARKSVPSVSLE